MRALYSSGLASMGFLASILLLAVASAGQIVPGPPAPLDHLKRGVNIGRFLDGKLENDSYGCTNNESHTCIDKDIAVIRTMGADHIRLLVKPGQMFHFQKQGLIAGKSLDALDEVVRSAVSQQIAIILALSLDEDRFNNKLKSDPEFPKELEGFWQALAAHYATAQYQPNLVLFEVLNEPGLDEPALTFEDWSRIQPGLVRAIRNGASQNTILAAGAEKSDINGLLALQTLKNVDNVIYVFHYYEPFSFTHQGEDWDKDHYAYHLAGVRYPYASEPAEKAAKDVPGLANKLNAWHDMETATKDRIKTDFEIVDEWAQNEKVTVICDEFGVLKRGSDPKRPMGADPGDSAEWVQDVRGLLEQHQIRWAFWDYSSESFGLLDKTGQFDKRVIAALGLRVPPTSTQVAPK